MLLVQPVMLSNWTISEQSTESLYYNYLTRWRSLRNQGCGFELSCQGIEIILCGRAYWHEILIWRSKNIQTLDECVEVL